MFLLKRAGNLFFFFEAPKSDILLTSLQSSFYVKFETDVLLDLWKTGAQDDKGKKIKFNLTKAAVARSLMDRAPRSAQDFVLYVSE